MRLMPAILIKERPSCLYKCPTKEPCEFFSFSILCWQIFSLLLGVLAARVGCSFLGWRCKLYFVSSPCCISRFTFLAFVSSWSSPSKNQRKNKSFLWPWGVNSLNWQHLEQQNQLEKWPLKFLKRKRTRRTLPMFLGSSKQYKLTAAKRTRHSCWTYWHVACAK